MRAYQWLCTMTMCFLGAINIAHASLPSEGEGIALESTRVIYPASEKNGIKFTVINRTPYVYLLQSRILPWGREELTAKRIHEGEVNMSIEPTLQNKSEVATISPFIVLPPLIRFAPDDVITLRIRLTKNDLPKNRESIFILSLKAIPSQQKQADVFDESGAKMVFALQNNLKLFYRPEGIAVMNANERAKALKFSKEGTQLMINNPTPYYVTLGQVKVDSIPLDLSQQRMLAPFSSAVYDLIHKDGDKMVSWQLIDDEGQGTPQQHQRLY